jgi:hypothetical protein
MYSILTHDIDMAINWVTKCQYDTKMYCKTEPCNFIKGTFDTIFQDEHITFDPQKEIIIQ